MADNWLALFTGQRLGPHTFNFPQMHYQPSLWSNSKNMEHELLESTNKARVYRTSTDIVTKIYITSDAEQRAAKDKQNLLFLNNKFKDTSHEGWIYGIVKFDSLTDDKTGINMNYVSGVTLSSLPIVDHPAITLHCGHWLAHYHNALIPNQLKGLIYTDLTTHNIVIDKTKKVIMVIDPGLHWGKTGFVYEDLLRFINSLLFLFVLKKRASPLSIKRFLKAYSNTAKTKFSGRIYYKALSKTLFNEFKRHAGKSALKSIIYSLAIVPLLPLYFIYIPISLNNNSASTEVRK